MIAADLTSIANVLMLWLIRVIPAGLTQCKLHMAAYYCSHPTKFHSHHSKLQSTKILRTLTTGDSKANLLFSFMILQSTLFDQILIRFCS
jgi:hypothetical protein